MCKRSSACCWSRSRCSSEPGYAVELRRWTPACAGVTLLAPVAFSATTSRQSGEMADVIQRLDRFDVEAGIARHFKLLTAFIGLPFLLTVQAHAALAGIDLHD